MARVRQTRQAGKNGTGADSDAKPLIVYVNSVFTAAALRKALGLRRTTLAREIASGRLRVSRRAGRYFFLGNFVLEWLQGGEKSRPTEGPTREG